MIHGAPPDDAPIVGHEAVKAALSTRIDRDRMRDIEEEQKLILAYRAAHNRATRRKAEKALVSFRRRMRKKYLGA